jgi:hypothetical protein
MQLEAVEYQYEGGSGKKSGQKLGRESGVSGPDTGTEK